MKLNSPTSPSRIKGQTPLPFAQIAVLMGVRLAEPIAYTVIFPFVNQMVEELGVTDNPDRVGFYSGLVESVFAFVQFFTVYHWAILSDKVGRKPVILFGLVGVVISGSLFGLANSFWMMIFFRCLSGALNGNVAVVRAAIGDVTDSSNSTEAFAMYGMTWTVGAIIGNALGGSLSHPYERFPEWFGSFEIFRIHPYLLPCLVTATTTTLGILFCLLFYKESLPSLANSSSSNYGHNRKGSLSFLRQFSSNKSHKRNMSTSSVISDTETLIGDDHSSMNLLSKLPRGEDGLEPEVMAPTQKKDFGFWQLMSIKPVRIMAVTAFLNSFVQGAWNAAALLFFFDRNNGLAMSTPAIGGAFAINGLVTILVQLILLKRIKKWLGITLGFKVLSFGWIFVWLLLPPLRTILLNTETPISTTSEGHLVFGEIRKWPITIFINLYLCFCTIVNMTGSLLMVLINTCSPNKNSLGAINGIMIAVGCMAKVTGPSLISALFAYSMDTQFMDGKAWWIFMVIMSIINFIITLLVKHDDPSDSNDLNEQDEVALSLLEDHREEEEDDYDQEVTPVDDRRQPYNTGKKESSS
ncbi:uncharacterized protein L201_004909 [Kwoniella dendrophila CBS 6074]|uniref:Major facilitator superfamily (MFS) profile domain-containing protein n=1 Tax=Kwoniella dendrophila CBS 6074 TaxID=1295534 RepID=A0AAX4JYQ1_9TREE